MKKLLIIFFVLIGQISLFGQSSNDLRLHSKIPRENKSYLIEQIEKVKNSCEYIFEGKVQRMEYYPRIDKNGKEYCAVSNIIKITKIFRGNLKPGLVEVIVKQKYYQGFQMPKQRGSYEVGSQDSICVYFCRKADNDYPYSLKYNIYPTDNKNILTIASDDIKCIIRMPDTDNELLFDKNSRTHPSKGDFYRRISKLPNIKMPFITAKDTEESYFGKITPGEWQILSKHQIDSIKLSESNKKSEKKKTLLLKRNDKKGSFSIKPIKRSYNSVFEASRRVRNIDTSRSIKSTLSQDPLDYVEIDYDNDILSSDVLPGRIDLTFAGSEFNLTPLTYRLFLNDFEPQNYNFNWDSDNANIEVDSETGLVTVYGVGNATITITVTFDYNGASDGNGTEYTDGEVTNSCQINVTEPNVPVTGVTLDNSTLSINDGEFETLTATVQPTYATDQNLTWTSSNPSIATVLEGEVTAVSPGTATITVETEDGNYMATCAVTVLFVPIQAFTLTPSLTMDGGTSLHLIPDILPTYATDKLAAFQSSNANIATVDQYGLVTALHAGIVTITATLDGFTAQCVITINPHIISVTSDSNDPSDLSAGDGQIITINGIGFGDYYQGTTCVAFRSSDDGALPHLNSDPLLLHDYDDFDYISWTDNQIEMYLPGIVTNTNTGQLSSNSVGSGDIAVESSPSNSSNPYFLQNINHNYIQLILTSFQASNGIKYSLKLANSIGVTGISFKLDPNVNFTTDEMNAINLAIGYWSHFLPLNISINSNSNNIISKKALTSNADMETTHMGGVQIINNNIKASITEIDIDNINASTWDYSLPGIGFPISPDVRNVYYDFLHELGHAFGLGHVNNEDDLMYFRSNNRVDLSNPYGDNYALSNAQKVVNLSETYPLFWLSVPTQTPPLPIIPIISFFYPTVISPYEVELDWSDADQNAFITLSRDNPQVTLYSSTGSGNFFDSNLTPNGNYDYKITSSNFWVTLSETLTVFTQSPFVYSTASGTETITWAQISTPSDPITGHTITRSSSLSGPTEVLSRNVDPNTYSFIDNSVLPGQTYYYQIITNYSSGGHSLSEIIPITACLNQSDLPYSQNISGPYSSDAKIEGYLISSNGSSTITSGITIYAIAANSIRLLPGFSAVYGSKFGAYIACTSNTTKSGNIQDSTDNGVVERLNDNLNQNLKIFPNPNNGVFKISVTNDNIGVISLLNDLGQPVSFKFSAHGSDASVISINNPQKGLYFIKLKGERGTYFQKIIIK